VQAARPARRHSPARPRAHPRPTPPAAHSAVPAHLAIPNLERLKSFYTRVSEAAAEDLGLDHAFIRLSEHTALHVFERPGVEGDAASWHHGPIDHFTLEATDLDAFTALHNRLLTEGCAQDTITDFGPLVSVFFHDPDGLLCEFSLWNVRTGTRHSRLSHSPAQPAPAPADRFCPQFANFPAARTASDLRSDAVWVD
jgi:catechol 2,3-dioxygenase-like lactoylglutathione lyase family enzyme